MLTEKESKIVKRIISGNSRRNRIFSITIMVVGFLIILPFSLYMKHKVQTGLKMIFVESNAILNNTKTSTELEKDLKFMAIRGEKDIQGIILDLVDLRFNWQVILFGALVLMVTFIFLRSSILENIIKKYQEEKGG